ncbi:hypothetical protein UZ36_07790 [Candidatus Nitromaritima sp. SCGC AAA799-C22]|nr:hypothetical protein UZ36_07790 [Candidatus Nitromaritima sp. SCGC AAA799-C22]
MIKRTCSFRKKIPLPRSLLGLLTILLMVFALTLTDWAKQVVAADPALSSIAHADENDDTDVGIKGEEAHVMVKGVTGKVKVKTDGGNIDLLVTSSDVKAESDSGDIFADGLTQKGKFKTKSGEVKVRYCRTPDSSGHDLKVKSDADGGVVDVQLPDDSEFKPDMDIGDAIFVIKPSSMECSSCGFKIKIKAKHADSVTVSGYQLVDGETDTCKY